EPLGVLHLVDRLSPRVARELGVSPVLLHLRVQEVLIDRGQLGGELLIEQRDYLPVPLHGGPSIYALATRSSDRFRIAQILRTQLAQSPPAPVASRIWRALRAPAAMQS